MNRRSFFATLAGAAAAAKALARTAPENPPATVPKKLEESRPADWCVVDNGIGPTLTVDLCPVFPTSKASYEMLAIGSMFETLAIRKMFGAEIYTNDDFLWVLTRKTWWQNKDGILMTLVFKHYSSLNFSLFTPPPLPIPESVS